MHLWLILALFGVLAAQPVAAQPAPAPPPASVPLPASAPLPAEQAPPARVGAVSYVSGNLAFHTAGDTQWSAAGVNYPVAGGGSFWTDLQARAQFQIGPTTIAMDGGTELDVTNLDEQVAQFGLPQGRVHFHLRQLDAGQSFEIDLPQGAVWLLQPGAYDISAGGPGQEARVAAYAGSARFVGTGADVGVKGGDAVVLSQTSPVTVATARAGPDAFVDWCAAHDYHEDHLASPYYISAQMTGYADLDRAGDWRTNPQYGEVWYPSQVPSDWAPYRDGRWIWVQPWGWTWVDRQPWGFAPFHYGRWAYVDNRWGWVPGNYVARPVYAPALVAFVGLGAAGIGVLTGVGPAVGWFPLAPGEAYWPSYTRNAAYIRNLNVTSVKNVNNIIVQPNGARPPQLANATFANRRFATVVPQRVFANADPVAPAIAHVAPATLQQAPVMLRPPEIRPAAAHAPVAGPPRGLLGEASLGANRPVPAAPGQPQRPETSQQHPGIPGVPGGRPANTAALPPRPGEIGPAERARPGPPAPTAAAASEHGGPPTAAHGEHPAAPNTAALPPHPAAAAPAGVGPVGPAPARPPAAESTRRESLPEARPRPQPIARDPVRPGPGPVPGPAPAPGPAVRAQAHIEGPAVVRPPPAPVHLAPVHLAPVHPATAMPHPPERAAAVHAVAVHGPQPAHGARPAPKEGGKGAEHHE
jgi:hypothetical protein